MKMGVNMKGLRGRTGREIVEMRKKKENEL